MGDDIWAVIPLDYMNTSYFITFISIKCSKAVLVTVIFSTSDNMNKISLKFYTVLLAEMVEPPAYGPEYDWLWVVKYVGYALSILILIIFIAVVFINPWLWEMFHLLRCNTAFCFLVRYHI